MVVMRSVMISLLVRRVTVSNDVRLSCHVRHLVMMRCLWRCKMHWLSMLGVL